MIFFFRHTLRLVLLAVFGVILSTTKNAGSSSSSSNNELQQAITKCRDKLVQDRTFAKAQYMLGMLLEATQAQAGAAASSDLDLQEEIAELSYQAGMCEERPLETNNRVDALIRAGNTFLQLGQTDRARQAYQKALTLTEDQSTMETILHQVTPFFFREDPTMTTTTMDSALSLSRLASLLTERFPLSAVVHQFQGAVSRKAGDLEGAFQSYHKATKLFSSSSSSPVETNNKTESYILAAAAARQAGKDLDTQLTYLKMALEAAAAAENNLNSAAADLQAEVYNNMGIAYKAAGQKTQAIDCFQSALNIKPGDGHSLAQLASLDAAPTQSAATATFDAAYVRGLFDGYSSRFEDELVNTLDYKGHEWVAEELLHYLEGGRGGGGSDCTAALTIVDLGCGTGLVGEALVSQQKLLSTPTLNLVGVDLSERMVEMARLRTIPGDATTTATTKVYQKVLQADAEAFLRELDPESINAIVAADVFIYVGDIQGVLNACWRALSAATGGLLVFSVEVTTTKEGVILLPSGRFGHSKKYIQHVANRTGFDLKLWKEGTLRKQHLAPVQGAVVVLQKRGN